MAANKDLNRLKVILVEKKKSNLWLSKELGCSPTTCLQVVHKLITAPFGNAFENNEVARRRPQRTCQV